MPVVTGSGGTRPITVLIADDDPVVLAAVGGMLDGHPDFTVVARVGDATAAVSEAIALSPDVALLDVRMPGGGGPHAAREILAKTAGTAIVALSAHQDSTTVRSMLRAGASGYAIKGTALAELVAILAHACGRGLGAAEVSTPGTVPLRRLTRVLIAAADPGRLSALSDAVAGDPDLELVGVAQSPTHAVSLAGRHHPDVALVDPFLPGGGGDRLLAELRLAAPGARVVPLDARAAASDFRAVLRGEFVPPNSDTPQLGHDGLLRAVLDHDDLDTLFQPIVNLRSGSTVGLEALTRFPAWPSRSTEVWFAEAARLGLGLELELAALTRAVGRIGDVAQDVFLSVNVSPEHLLDPGVFSVLTDGPAERLVVEVTEHARVPDYDVLGGALDELRGAGVRIAVDDAGAGFASLRHIVLLRPDLIKLDGAICRGVGHDRARAAMARALVAFAQEIGSEVIAEGIEDADELAALRALGIGLGQGDHLAPPEALPYAPA